MKIFGYEIKKAPPKEKTLVFHPKLTNPQSINYIQVVGGGWAIFEGRDYAYKLEELFESFQNSPILSSITPEQFVEILKVVVGEEYCKFELKR